MPQIESVSYNYSTQEVQIKWAVESDPDTRGYYVFEGIGSSMPDTGFYSVIATVNDTSVRTWKFSYPKVSQQAVYFAMSSFDSTKNVSGQGHSSPHRTIFLTYDFDSCNMVLNLSWSKYYGWGDKLTYTVRAYVNATYYGPIAPLSANDTTYTLTGVLPDSVYSVLLIANNTDNSLTSYSNVVIVPTYVPTLPSSILAQSANYSGSSVDLTFQLDPTAQVRDYRLLRSSQSGGPFTPIDSFMNWPSATLTYTDSPGGDATMYYRLEALNACGKSSGIQSNRATAIVPKYTLTAQQVNLSWDNYLNWGSGVQEYRINRSVSGQPFNYVSSTSGTTPNYTDNLGALVGQQLSGNVCYYIESVAAGSTSYTSRSQTICIDLTSDIFVPNAFTPNGDGVNDEFLPSFAFLPDKFYMSIYNRFGTKIFETDDPSRGWKGITSAGQRAPEGVYIYLITYYSASGAKKQKNGSFSLIYP